MPQISNPYGFRLVKSKTSAPSFGSQLFPVAQCNTTGLINFSTSTPSAGTPDNTAAVPAAGATNPTYLSNAGLGMGDPVGFTYSGAGATSLDSGLSTGNIGYVSWPLGNTAIDFTGTATVSVAAVTQYKSIWGIVGIFSGLASNSALPNVQRPSPVPYILNGTQVNVSNGVPSALYATISDQQWQVWQVQTNGIINPAYTQSPNTPVGLNFNFTYGLGMNPATGNSRAQLFTYNSYALSTVAPNLGKLPLTVPGNSIGNAPGFFKIVGLAPANSGQTNNWTDPYVDVLVVINTHYLSGQIVCANA